MPALGASARFSSKGDRNSHVSMDDALENKGFALWTACQGKIRNTGRPMDGPPERGLAGVDGYAIEVNLKRKALDLWPDLHHRDKQTQATFTQEVYAYLRASGNAVCIKQPGTGEHGIPTWWLRKTWNDVAAVGVFRPTELTKREQRLTAAEAGEDRKPAPVTVRQREEAAEAADAKDRSPDEQTRKISEEREGVLETLKHALVPMHQIELADAIRVTNLRVGKHLRDMINSGEVFRRLEDDNERADGVNGRKRYLYWREQDIPYRDPAERMPSNPAIDRINALKPGESLSISWMSPSHLREIDELVAVGILEKYEDRGPRIRLAEGAATGATEETIPVPVMEPAPKPTPAAMPAKTSVTPVPAATPPDERGIDQIARLIEDLVRVETRQRSATKDEEITQLKIKLSSERNLTDKAGERADKAEARARDLEAKLVAAHAELSAERERMRKARELFGA